MRTGLAIVCGLALLRAASGAAAAEAGCQGALIGGGQVKNVIDGRTLELTDGREVRLAGVEAPERSRPALQALVEGQAVSLMRLGPDSDRYGRTVALVALANPSGGPSVQTALLERGWAQVAARIADFACAAALLGAEQRARTAGLGLWADPYYVIRDAEDLAGILAISGRFAVVEGQVLSVRESGATIYVNFGRRWSEDFTVTVPKRNERSFTAAGLPLKKLAGQRVRVRGTIEERGGPWIEAEAPGQIEIAGRGSSGHE